MKIKYGCQFFPVVLLLVASTPLAGQDPLVNVESVRAVDRESRQELSASEQEGLSVEVTRVVVQAGETLRELLDSRSVLADADAYLLVYELNPEVDDADRIPAGMHLLLPSAVAIDGMVPSDVLLDIDVHREEQMAAQMAIAAIAYQDVKGMDALQLDDALLASVQRLDNALTELSAVSFEGSAVSPTALALLEEDARLAGALMAELWSGNTAAIENVDDVVAEIEVVLGCRRNNTHCEVPVRVRPVRAGQVVSGLQVYAAPRGKFKTVPGCRTTFSCGEAFPKLSPDATHHLVPTVPYVFWALREGELIAGPKEYEPRYEGENEVDLTVLLGEE